MVRGSHYLSREQFAIAKGMRLRGDAVHDIMSYFGENSGRYYDAERRYPTIEPVPADQLPALHARQKVALDPNAPLAEQIKQLKQLIATHQDTAIVLTLVPELMQWVLENLNTNNRKQRRAKIKKFAQCLTNGAWQLTGDTIKFGRSGLLLDGQNRLAGCVLAGLRMETYVVFNIDDDAFAVIDTGTTRTNQDTLKIFGVPYEHVATPAVRWIMLHMLKLDRGKTFDNAEMLEYYRNKIDKDALDRAVKDAIEVGSIIPQGNFAAYIYLARRINAKATDRLVADCINYVRGGRKLIDKLETLRKQQMGRIHEDVKNAIIILAWKAYRRGNVVTKTTLNWTESKDFPTLD